MCGAISDEDLELIFSRFGEIMSCEIIKDFKTGDSLQYAFIEAMSQCQTNQKQCITSFLFDDLQFADSDSCEQAYLKMDNVGILCTF